MPHKEDIKTLEDTKDKTSHNEPHDEPAANSEIAKLEAEPEGEQPPTTVEATKPKRSLKAFLASKKGRIILAASGVALLLVGVLFAVPTTRYAILGTVVKKEVTLSLTDVETAKPVSEAEVSMAGYTAKSDNEGKVKFAAVPAGPQQVTVKKKYYQDAAQTVNVWLTKPAEPAGIQLQATGRQVPVKVLNKISSQPLEGALLTVGEATALTDAKGEAALVLPADQGDQKGKVTRKDHNDLDVTVTLTEQPSDKNVFSLTPAGKLYFLSKRTGKINVMKSDLDGGNAQVVLEGTGKEEDTGTILLASRDWKYLILKARRDSDDPKVYLIETGSDKLSVVDEGKATFNLAGWADHRFIYTVVREGESNVEDSRGSIKSFNAETGQLNKIDVTSGGHNPSVKDFGQYYGSDLVLLGNEVVFEKHWPYGYFGVDLSGKKTGVYSMQADGSNKHAIIEAETTTTPFYTVRAYGAKELYIRSGDNSNKTYEYEDGKLTDKGNLSYDEFYKTYPTYLVSPSGQATFWTESRDGKNTLLLGNNEGKDGKNIAELSDYKQYGWFTEEYLLASKNSSELFILHKDHADTALKVTDYHKPAIDFFNYGGGYGGY